MRAASVFSRHVSDTQRMDPGFHLLEQEHETRSAALRERLTEAQARTQLAVLPVAFLEPLGPLMRGSVQRQVDETGVRREARLHPFLALALVEAFLPTLTERAQAQQREAEARFAAIEALSAALGTPEIASRRPPKP